MAELRGAKGWDEAAHFAVDLGLAWLVGGLVYVGVVDRWGGVADRQMTAGLVDARLVAPQAEEAAPVVVAAAGLAAGQD